MKNERVMVFLWTLDSSCGSHFILLNYRLLLLLLISYVIESIIIRVLTISYFYVLEAARIAHGSGIKSGVEQNELLILFLTELCVLSGTDSDRA